MEKTKLRRLLFAAAISAACFAINLFWYYKTGSVASESNDAKPIAYVGKTIDEIQRRPTDRLIWNNVQTGDPLYTGEAVKTSKEGEVRIQFADSESYIDLESDSLIVIQQTSGEINLDLMEGSLFVNTTDKSTTAPNLSLTSKQGKVDLSKAKVSLSKSAKGLDVQVLEGTATLKDSAGNTQELQKGKSLNAESLSVEIVSPDTNKVHYLNADAPAPIFFKWRNGPRGKYEIYLGSTRKNLSSYSSAQYNQNTEAKLQLPPGKHYWKLVLKDSTTERILGETPTYRLEVVNKYPPLLVFPDAFANIPLQNLNNELNLKWSNPEYATSVALEIARDPNMKQIVVSKNVGESTTFKLSPISAGTYYWRLGAYEAGGTQAIVSKVNQFTVGEVKAPEPTPPPPPPVAQKPIAPNLFWGSVTDRPQLYTENPILNLTWATDKPQEIASYKIIYYPEGGTSQQAQSIQVNNLSAAVPLRKPGRYIASVEALDKESRMIASLPAKTILVQPMPLLKSPDFTPLDTVFEAQADGSVELNWTAIAGAKEYSFKITSAAGKEIMSSKYRTTTIKLSNLMPGEYNIEVVALDASGRASEKKPARILMVPDNSNVQAPKLKKIKVK
jgi:hypothetical protein